MCVPTGSYSVQVPPDAWLDTSWLDEYQGLSIDEASSLAQRQGRPLRVVRPDSVLTADLNKQRLNINVADDGTFIGFRAG